MSKINCYGTLDGQSGTQGTTQTRQAYVLQEFVFGDPEENIGRGDQKSQGNHDGSWTQTYKGVDIDGSVARWALDEILLSWDWK